MRSAGGLAGKMVLLTTILASGMAFLDGSVVNVAIPVIQTEFNADLAQIQWIINGYTLILASLILISSVLGDKFGRKKIFTYGITVFIFASFLCGISRNISQLIFFRFFQGLGAAMMVPGSLSIINVYYDKSVRGRAIGLWSGFSGGIAALGPFLGGVFVQFLGWSSIFFINIPLGLLALFLAIRFIPETKNNDSTRIDILGAILIFISLFGITYGLITGPIEGWSRLTSSSLILGIISFIAFIMIESLSRSPLIPFKIFKSSLVKGANIATLFLYFALSGAIFFLILNFEQIQHYPPLLAGFGISPAIILITFLSGFGGTLADKIGPRIPMILGPLIVSSGIFLITLAGRNANYFLQFMPGLILIGLGMSIVIAPLTKSALAVEYKFSGAASGINNAVARIAGLMAITLLSAVVVFTFDNQLQNSLSKLNLQKEEKQKILIQKNRISGIKIPPNFDANLKKSTQTAIDDSSIYAFRWVMGINAFLALTSSFTSALTIHNGDSKKPKMN